MTPGGGVDLLSELLDRLRGIDGLTEGASRFGPGPAFWCRGREVAHLDDDGGPLVLDVRLGRAGIRGRREALRADPRVTLRPSSSADWLQIAVHEPEDLDAAAALVAGAVAGYGRWPSR